jgi:hypothetical protein
MLGWNNQKHPTKNNTETPYSWKGQGEPGKVCTRAVVCRKNSAIVQTDVHAVMIEKSMTTRGSDEDLRAEKANVHIGNMVPHEFLSDHGTPLIS